MSASRVRGGMGAQYIGSVGMQAGSYMPTKKYAGKAFPAHNQEL
jgi:hypothetical protein